MYVVVRYNLVRLSSQPMRKLLAKVSLTKLFNINVVVSFADFPFLPIGHSPGQTFNMIIFAGQGVLKLSFRIGIIRSVADVGTRVSDDWVRVICHPIVSARDTTKFPGLWCWDSVSSSFRSWVQGLPWQSQRTYRQPTHTPSISPTLGRMIMFSLVSLNSFNSVLKTFPYFVIDDGLI